MNKSKKTQGTKNSKRKIHTDTTTGDDPQGNVSPRDDLDVQENDELPRKKNVPSSDGNHDKRRFLTLTSSFDLSDDAKYVVEHGFDKSSKVQIVKFLDEIIPPLIDRMTPQNEEVDQSVPIALSFLKTLQNWTDYEKRHAVQCLLTNFSTSFSNPSVDSVWRSHMVQLITKFVQTTHFSEHSKFGVLLLGHLFSVALQTDGKPVTSADIKRIKELKMFILQVDLLDPSMNHIMALFMKAVVSKDFLKNRDGVLVIAHFLSKEASLVKLIQTQIRENLFNFPKKLAGRYGEVYFHAWILSEEGSLVRKEIEQRCIQDIMLRAMTLKRNGLEMGPVGNLTFAILQVLRANRRWTKFSQLMTDLYQPILWRNLKSPNPIVRCNAAQIFLDVFPLEKVGQGATVNCSFIEMQVKEMKDLLLDECHLVRVIAIRGLAQVLIQSSAVISVRDIKDMMFILTDKLARDATPLVPCAVFGTFENLVASDRTREMAIPILKNMRLCLHDINERVRKAFVKILLRLKDLADPKAFFWDVVPFKHILYRLEEEKCPVVGEMLAKLIFSSVYQGGQSINKTMSNLIKFINISDVALMKLFKFGRKEIKLQEAYNIIASIVGVVNMKIKEKMVIVTNENSAENEGSNADTPTSHNRQKKSGRTLRNITNIDSEDGDSSSSESSSEPQPPTENKPDFLEDHKVVAGLLNAVSLLWAIYAAELKEEGKYDTISLIATPAVPLLLRYYKGTRVYYNVISFATLIPIQQLAPHSTVTGSCIAELREMDETSDPEKIKCLITALCLWYRGLDVVELAVDWLNQAFRHENLNSTLLPRSNRKKTVVRFRPTQGKPFMAIQLLETAFGHSVCEQRLRERNYDQLHDTFLYIERIKELVERRLENGDEFKEPDLSDLFLERCLNIYLSMVIMLNRPPGQTADADARLESASASSVLCEMLNWAHRVFLPHLKEETEPQYIFASKCIKLVLKSSVLAVDLSYTDKLHSLALGLLSSKLMSTGTPLPFLEVTVDVIKCLCEYSRVYNTKDEWEIFSTVIPNLLQQCLDVIASVDVTQEDLLKVMENSKKFKVTLFHPLPSFKLLFDVKHEAFQRLCNFYLSTCIQLVAREIVKENEIELYSKLDGHPLFVSLIMKYFLSKPTLAALILPWLQAHISLNKQDPIEIISCISLISTLLLSFKSKFEVDRLEETVGSCYEILMSLENEEEVVSLVKSRGEEILLEVCKTSGCALRRT